MKWAAPLFAVLGILACLSCQTFSYYGQMLSGHLEVMTKAEPISEVLADPTTPPDTAKALRTVGKVREFAAAELGLPSGRAYTRYTDLKREHVVWVLNASNEFSVEPKTWFYPVVGRLSYRGYYDEQKAEAAADRLRAEGFETYVAGINAYSTLGWFADPVLNTFIDYHELLLAELIIHELVHRRYYRRGATAFNEALAMAVAEEGVRRWLRTRKEPKLLAAYERYLKRRNDLYDDILTTRDELAALYAQPLPEDEMRARKTVRLLELQREFLHWQARWKTSALEDWTTEPLTNAHLNAANTYYRHIPFFQKLLEDCDGDLEQFFDRVKSAELPQDSPQQPR